MNQTEGRGQYGRPWLSEPGNHLAISIILQPENMLLEDLPLLSMKTSVAVARTLHALVPYLKPLIKWPNDIYVDDKKLAGILIENSISTTKVQHCIFGIGMNVNETKFRSDLRNPVSLFMLTGKKYEILPIAEKLRTEVINVAYESLEKWKPEYDQLIYRINEDHEFLLNGKKISAKILGVENDGKLKVSIDGLPGKSYFSHEIKWS